MSPEQATAEAFARRSSRNKATNERGSSMAHPATPGAVAPHKPSKGETV